MQKKLKYKPFKYKAYALVYAVFIMLIVTLITASFIFFAHLHKIYFQDYRIKEQQIANVMSGIQLVMAAGNSRLPSNGEKISLYGGYYDSVTLSQNQWGLYDIITAISDYRNFTFRKAAMAGGFYKTNEAVALHLADHNKAVSLCGNTILKGLCYLPRAGIKKAMIDGKYFKGVMPSNNQIYHSSDSLPELLENFLSCSYQAYEQQVLNEQLFDLVSLEDLQNDSLFNSFFNKPKLIILNENNSLLYQKLTGNIIVFSFGNVTVTANSFLKDVLLIAPSIKFEDGFTGTLQAFASDTILTGENCQFNYPSSLGIIHTNEPDCDPFILINSKVDFSGIICVYVAQNYKGKAKKPQIRIEEDAHVQGQVYCNGYIEHKGAIEGSLWCDGFLLYRASGLYENYMLDAIIDMTQLNEYFTGCDLTGLNNPYKIVKWME